MFERTNQVAGDIYYEVARKLRHLLGRVKVVRVDLQPETVVDEFSVSVKEPNYESVDLEVDCPVSLYQMPEAEVIVSDIDIDYEPKEVELFESVEVAVQPMLIEELIMPTVPAGLWIEPPAANRVPVGLPKWSFNSYDAWLPEPIYGVVRPDLDVVVTKREDDLPKARVRTPGPGFLRGLPIRRKRTPMHIVPEKEKEEAWDKLVADSGVSPDRLSLLGMFDGIPVSQVKKIIADDEGLWVDVYLKGGYLDRSGPKGRLVLGRDKVSGKLQKAC